MRLDWGIPLEFDPGRMTFAYGPGVLGPETELRTLDAIRASLLDPDCDGPDRVYGIAMDVRRAADEPELRRRNLLFGVVAYAAGKLGREPVRSQGHIHRIASHSGWSPPEIFEIWHGEAIIYMQEHVADATGRCIAVHALPGDKVVVPPGWGHAAISADPHRGLIFGAWCDREYGFEYAEVRSRGGLAWFSQYRGDGSLTWIRNERYHGATDLIKRKARSYPELSISPDLPLYMHYVQNAASIQWVAKPGQHAQLWRSFEP